MKMHAMASAQTMTTRRPACSVGARLQQQQPQHIWQRAPSACPSALPSSAPRTRHALRAPRASTAGDAAAALVIDPPDNDLRSAEQAPNPSSSSSSSAPHWDVQAAVISPAFRSTPWAAEKAASAKTLRTTARVLFVGESNICRSVLALSITNKLLAEYGLQDCVECEAKGTRNYVIGQGPEPSTVEAARQLGWVLPDGVNSVARRFEEDEDIVNFDLILVMDKFTAADVLREVSGFDLINPNGFYSVKVRLLGEFHPTLRVDPRPGAQDIDDPLYGNVGGSEEYEAVLNAASTIEQSCRGLLSWLKEMHEGMEEEGRAAGSGAGSGSFAALVKQRVRCMKQIEWLVPPMLQPRT